MMKNDAASGRETCGVGGERPHTPVMRLLI